MIFTGATNQGGTVEPTGLWHAAAVSRESRTVFRSREDSNDLALRTQERWSLTSCRTSLRLWRLCNLACQVFSSRDVHSTLGRNISSSIIRLVNECRSLPGSYRGGAASPKRCLIIDGRESPTFIDVPFLSDIVTFWQLMLNVLLQLEEGSDISPILRGL